MAALAPAASVSRARATVVMPPTARITLFHAPALRQAQSSSTWIRQGSHTAAPEAPAGSRPGPPARGPRIVLRELLAVAPRRGHACHAHDEDLSRSELPPRPLDVGAPEIRLGRRQAQGDRPRDGRGVEAARRGLDHR